MNRTFSLTAPGSDFTVEEVLMILVSDATDVLSLEVRHGAD